MTIGTRIILKDRKPLETLLPLEAPLVLFIDPSDACCLKCNFCPTGDYSVITKTNRPLQQMHFELYKKIIDDLQEFETKVKVVRLYGHGEPLLNRHFCDMVKYAKNSGKVEMVDTTTNGILFNPILNQELLESKIDRINISVNGLSDEQYFQFTKTKINFKKYVENIIDLYERTRNSNCYIFIKINGDTITEEEEYKFLQIFEPIADAVAIEKSMTCWNGFESKGFIRKDNNVGIYGQEINTPVDICPYVFYQIFIHSNGDTSLCFLDWDMKMIIGDAFNQSIKEIWEGNKLQSIRQMMLYGKRNCHPICRNCDQLLKGMPSNIDLFRKQLIKKYNF